MVTLTRRGANAVAVLLAASGIGLLSLAWALTSADGDTVVGAEVIQPEATPRSTPRSTPTAPRVERKPAPFADDFEQGLDRWRVVGSAVTTRETASRGSRSVTLTEPACRGDAFTRRVPVDAGSTYRLRTDYRTDGGGGYIGLDLYAASGVEAGEQWLIGDGGFPTYDDVRWDYNVDEQDPADLGSWGRYEATYVVPRGVASVSIKIEDWGCGGLPDDPAGAPVYFDRILLTRTAEGPG